MQPTAGGGTVHTLADVLEPERIELRQGVELVVTWPDGRVDVLTAAAMRDACACAACRDTRPPPADPATCRIAEIGLVGAYAVNVVFAPDGHATGIYPFTALRALADGQ